MRWGDESVTDALKKLIPFLFPLFCNLLIFKSKKIGGTKAGSQLETLSATFSSAQLCGVRRPGVTHHISAKYFGALRLAPNAPYEAGDCPHAGREDDIADHQNQSGHILPVCHAFLS